MWACNHNIINIKHKSRDQMSKEANKRHLNQSSRMKSQQLIKHKDLSKSTRLGSESKKYIDYMSLNQEFQGFKQGLMESMKQKQFSGTRSPNNPRFTSLSASNLLSYQKRNKGNAKNSVPNNQSFEYNLRNILQNSSQNQSAIYPNATLILLQQKMAQMFNKFISPIHAHMSELNTRTLVLQELTSRLKYQYKRKNPKFNRTILPATESPIYQKIKRKSTPSVINSRLSTLSASNNEEEKRMLEISLKSLLDQQKSSHDVIYKKNRLIDLLVQQIQEVETKRQTDVEILRQEITQNKQRHIGQLSEMETQLMDARGQIKQNQYKIEQLKANISKWSAKYQQIQIQLSKSYLIGQQRSKNNQELTERVKELIQELEQSHKKEIQNTILAQENHNLNLKLCQSIKDTEFYKRCNEEQYKKMEKEFRDIDEGYSKLKAANNILRSQLGECNKEILSLRKQLRLSRTDREDADDGCNDCQDLLEKNQVEVSTQELERKALVLEKLLEESELKRLMAAESHQMPRKGSEERYNEEVFRSLKQFISKLQEQILEKDRRIWLLENNLLRIKSNKRQLPLLFSPKQGGTPTPNLTVQKGAGNGSTRDQKQSDNSHLQLVESIMVEGFSLSRYI